MEWRTVEGFDGIYEVSEWGHVRNIRTGRELKPSIGTKYLHVVLCNDGHKRTISVHKLVACAFIGKCPSQNSVCCHNDGDKTNNHFSNLRWDSQSGNLRDRWDHGTAPTGSRGSNNKYTDEMVGLVLRGEITSSEAKLRWGMSQPTYSAIKTGKTWKLHPDRR